MPTSTTNIIICIIAYRCNNSNKYIIISILSLFNAGMNYKGFLNYELTN